MVAGLLEIRVAEKKTRLKQPKLTEMMANLPTARRRRIYKLLSEDRVKLVIRYIQKNSEASTVEIMADFDRDRFLPLPRPSLYPLLIELEIVGIIELARVDRARPGRPRKYYRATEFGLAALQAYLEATASLRQ